MACARNDMDHRLTKPKHPWTNGQVERMNRTIKEATVKRSTTTPTTSCAATSPTSSAPTASQAHPVPLRSRASASVSNLFEGGRSHGSGDRRKTRSRRHAACGHGKSKIVKNCNLPLTSARTIDPVVTDMVVIGFLGGRATLMETAPG